MNSHKKCNVSGHYCWDHKQTLQFTPPGWAKVKANEYTHYSPWASNANGGVTESIVWANGDVHSNRGFSNGDKQCSLCGLNCQNPVEPRITNQYDGYREIKVSVNSKE